MALKSISSVGVKGKKVILRVDLNSSVQEGKVIPSARLRGHSKTIKELSDKGASLVVFSHQGRKGREDFVSLKQHAKIVSGLTGKKVHFIEKERELLEFVSQMKQGKIVLFENTRFFEWEEIDKSAEEHAKNSFISGLASLCDFFVLDGFSISHRSHGSVVGFAFLLPSFMGRIFESELRALEKTTEFQEKPRSLVLGGAKPEDSIKVIEFFLSNSKTENVLAGGLLGEYLFKAAGFQGKEKEGFFEEKGLSGFASRAKKLAEKFSESIFLPLDFAVKEDGKRKEISAEELTLETSSFDIGQKTIGFFSKKIKESKLIVFNGPPGVFEDKEFSFGSKELFKAIASSEAFSFLGGGDTETALSKLGFKAEQFSHVSVSGKAALKFLSGAPLPGIEALKKE